VASRWEATTVRFEHSGHGLFIEEEDKFNKELMKFAN
jgi:pimeloyl-ACP methyl ester carboxylesterase